MWQRKGGREEGSERAHRGAIHTSRAPGVQCALPALRARLSGPRAGARGGGAAARDAPLNASWSPGPCASSHWCGELVCLDCLTPEVSGRLRLVPGDWTYTGATAHLSEAGIWHRDARGAECALTGAVDVLWSFALTRIVRLFFLNFFAFVAKVLQGKKSFFQCRPVSAPSRAQLPGPTGGFWGFWPQHNTYRIR